MLEAGSKWIKKLRAEAWYREKCCCLKWKKHHREWFLVGDQILKCNEELIAPKCFYSPYLMAFLILILPVCELLKASVTSSWIHSRTSNRIFICMFTMRHIVSIFIFFFSCTEYILKGIEGLNISDRQRREHTVAPLLYYSRNLILMENTSADF